MLFQLNEIPWGLILFAARALVHPWGLASAGLVVSCWFSATFAWLGKKEPLGGVCSGCPWAEPCGSVPCCRLQ